MGGRYLVTGVQLAMLQVDCKSNGKKFINQIIDNQFIWDSDKGIDKDIETLIKKVDNGVIK